MKPYHIDDDVNIKTDEDALQALEETNDQEYISPDSGIVTVSKDRWQQAQKAERNHWMVRGIRVNNDRNESHKALFNDYSDLKNKHFQSAIELGCGPFTNMSIIGKLCQIEQVTLLDPLIESYLTHPFSNYTKDTLYLRRESQWHWFLQKIVGKINPSLYKSLMRPILHNRTIPIKQIIASPIEAMPIPEETHDLAIMINVIEHCYDIHLIFKQIVDMLALDGLFVFHDRYYNHDEVSESIQYQYDAAHPLKVDRRVIDKFLDTNFTPLYHHIGTEHMSFRDSEISYDTLYFIGRKK